MSEKLQAVFTGLRRGVYAPVSTNGRDEEEEGLVQGPVDEKSSIGRSNFGSFVRPVVQCFLVVGLMAASYTFGSYSARVPTTSTGFIPESTSQVNLFCREIQLTKGSPFQSWGRNLQ